MELFTLVLFALALNLDSLGAGVAYGARQIKVPPTSLLIISLISVSAITISMLGGKVVASFIPVSLAHRLGGFILLCIGAWVLFQTRRAGHPPKESSKESPKLFEIKIKPLGLAVQILSEPARADLDSSGVISAREAVLLGAALAMDAFAAGFAVSMLGYSIAITAMVVGLGHFALTYLGILAGRTVTSTRVGRQLTALPGFILIMLGLFKIH